MLSKCQFCKNEFHFHEDKIHKGKYCSRSCYQKSRWGNRKELRKCKQCGAPFTTFKSVRKSFCKRECGFQYRSENIRGINHPRFQFRIRYGKNGRYWAILQPHHPFADSKGYVMEHRLIMEKQIGRFLKEDECVHHIDENPSNNEVSNLRLMLKKDHDALHSLDRWSSGKMAKRTKT